MAALPIPKKFAVMFIEMYSRALAEALGNSRRTAGEINRQIAADTPLFSAIRIIPVQKHIAPARERSVDTAVDAPSNMAFIVSSTLPVTIADTSDTKIIPHQIIFISTTSYRVYAASSVYMIKHPTAVAEGC